MSIIRLQTLFLLCLLLFVAVTFAADDHDHDHDHDHDEELEHDDHDHDDHEEENIGLAFAITTGAGLAALIGACSIFCVKKEWVGLISASLSFSAGVIIYLSFMGLIPESIHMLEDATGSEEALCHFYALLCVICGLGITVGMEMLFKKLGVHSHGDPSDMSSGSGADTSSSVAMTNTNGQTTEKEEASNEEEEEDDKVQNDIEKIQNGEEANLSYISYTVAFALILHHFPEGIATFVSLYYDLEFGVLVAFALAIHDIPSGICISVTSYCATGSMVRPFVLCGIAALTYPIGALIGWAVVETASDEFKDVFVGVLFGITGGIMLYVAFIELLPAAILNAKKNERAGHKNVYTISLCLLFVGFLVMDISAILLAESGGHSH